MTDLNPNDVLAATFLFYPSEEFKNDREKIHSAFSKIRANHFDILKNFIFRENLLFPRSRVLDEMLSGLQPDFLGKINPTYKMYQIKKENLQKLWDLELKQLLKEKEDEIKKIAEELYEFLQ